MKKLSLILIAAMALGLTACKEEKTTSEVTEKSVVNGTEIESTTKTETVIDGDGSRTTETERKTTVDPEGMMNKETTEEETHTEEVEQ